MNKKVTSVLLSACMVLSLAGCKKDQPAEPQSTDPATKAINVTVTPAALSSVTNKITYTGEVKPSEEVAVSAKASGKVKSVKVDVGSAVKAGDVLFTIEDTDYALQVTQAQASYNSAQASYNSTISGTQKQSVSQVEQALTSSRLEVENATTNLNREKELYEANSNVVLAENAVKDAQAAYDRAKQLYDDDTAMIAARNAVSDAQANYDRTKSLFDLGATTQVTLDSAKTSLENAQASLQSLESNNQAGLDAAKTAVLQAEENLRTVKTTSRASLDAAESRLINAKEALKVAQDNYNLTVNVLNPERAASAEAQLKSAKVALDIAKNNLNNTVIKAPISGSVTTKTVAAGQMAQAGSPAVSLINTASMDVEINVTESDVASLSLGSPAQIGVASAGLSGLPGTVSAISPAKDAATGMFKVKINVPNSTSTLKGGMFAQVDLITKQADNVMTVPSEAVIRENDAAYVYIVNGDKAEKREITPGMSDEQNTEILSGVNGGENVVLKGKEYITEEKNTVKVVSE